MGAGLLAGGLALGSLAAPPPVDPAQAQPMWSYRIVRGDTLIGVAATQLGPGAGWRPLQRLNRVANPRRLQPGQVLRIPLAWLRVQPVRAEVLHVQGDVRVQRGGSAGSEVVAAGATLGSGDLLLAGPESALALKFADGSRLLVRPDTQVRFERLVQIGASGVPDTRLRLDSGSIDSHVQPAGAGRRYDIGTPSVNLGVRGTEFRTQVEPQTRTTRVEVIEGSVAADNAAQAGTPAAAIGAGFGTVVALGQPVAAPRRLLDAPDLGPVPARLERVPLRLAWSPLAGASDYRAQVFPAEGVDAAGRLLLDGRFKEPGARWRDLPDGRYELRVRGVDAQGLEGRDARRSFVLKARPEPPFTRQPRADARLYGEPTRLAWTRAEGVASYRLQLADSADFSAPRADLAGLSGTEHDIALPPGSYHWRVASVRADGDAGPFGDAQAFTVRPVPPAPPLQPPRLSEAGVVLRWAAGEAGQTYALQVARDAAFTDLVQEQASAQPEATLALPPPGRYYLRVRAVDADGQAGPWGGVQLIDVPQSRWWLLLPALLLLLVL
ncbi:FecR domain-containing protein [Aquabacterium sp.]|uniref:FecR domain-containing protein n=1 Tax=Aquabacterium sp. TaxID=1872578 RepID=UPI002D13E900|nr:FecR domain-containing protein [Aquabacterium sp.]HSW07210.1 FecR domain-containing protein [Aquabacterium sp.]